MNSGEIIGVIEKFFLDIIGTVLPGAALIMGVDYVIGQPLWDNYLKLFLFDITIYKLLLVVAVSYIIGHAVTSFGENIVTKFLEAMKKKYPKSLLLNRVTPKDELFERIMNEPIFKSFVNSIFTKIPHIATLDTSKMNYTDWRSLAMSVTQEHSHRVYRFMFLSLLNLGIASVLVIIFISWIILLTSNLTLNIDMPHYHFSLLIMALVMTLVVPFAFYLFLDRYYFFYRIAMNIPISMAYVKIEILTKEKPNGKEYELTHHTFSCKEKGNIMKVYLAGGFRSGWQDKVISNFPSVHFFDPSKHNLVAPKEYTLWDLEAIRSSDCIFAYLEENNPGGYALALEVGFAKALCKLIIFVDEKSSVDKEVAKYLTMIVEASDITLNSLQDGINYLQQIADLRKFR